MTFEAIPPWIRVALSTSTNVSPPTSTSSGGAATTGARPSTARSIALTPCQGRAEWALSPRNVERRVEVAEAAGVDRVVGRLEHDDEVGLEDERRLGEDARERALARRRAPRARRRGTRGRARARRASAAQRASSIITASPPFMSLAPRPTTRPSSIRPGRLSWAGTVSRWPASRTSGAPCARSRRGAPRRCRRRAEAARRRRRARGGAPPPGSARGCRSARACGVPRSTARRLAVWTGFVSVLGNTA